jgi:peptidoglycan/xylan/chitin deacetylase (PgdA/CDA1 family)
MAILNPATSDKPERTLLRRIPKRAERTKVVLTVDIEPSVAGAFVDRRHTPLIHEPVGGDVDGKSEALGFVIETLRQYGLTATFFVETVHTRYFGSGAMGDYVETLVRAGQDVQLHLHPCWLSFRDGRLDPSGPLTDKCGEVGVAQLTDLIEVGVAQLTAWTGVRPSGMRTGNFSAALAVFEAMRRAGLRHSSNICLAVEGPLEPNLALAGGIHRIAGICELPVTCFADIGPIGRGRLRSMQINALTTREQINLLNAAHACGNPVAVIVTHPFDFLKKRDFRYTDLRPNRIVQRRFRRLCEFLAENGDRFDVSPLAVVADAIGTAHPRPWTELTGNWVNASIRAAQNGLNDRIFFL